MYRTLLCAASLALCSSAVAKDLGVRGEIFPVIERDLFSDIAERFAAMEASGEVEAVNQRLKARALAAAHRPAPVQGLRPTANPRSWHHDPSVILTQDIRTPDGQLLAEAGERFNPLEFMPFNQVLVFFDADDQDQLSWAEDQLTRTDTVIQPILVKGAVIDLMRDWERPVWFDQKGELTKRFAITQTPARVSRDGDHLLIEEVAP